MLDCEHVAETTTSYTIQVSMRALRNVGKKMTYHASVRVLALPAASSPSRWMPLAPSGMGDWLESEMMVAEGML